MTELKLVYCYLSCCETDKYTQMILSMKATPSISMRSSRSSTAATSLLRQGMVVGQYHMKQLWPRGVGVSTPAATIATTTTTTTPKITVTKLLIDGKVSG